MAQAIILAAGYSSRAQTNKMLLPYEGKPLILHAIDGVRPYVNNVFVVTGHYHQEILGIVKGLNKVTVILNEQYQNGMFSSVLKGVEAVHEDFFILPGDCPFVSKKTYLALLESKNPISVPAYQGQTGHPLFIKHALKTDLLSFPPTSNLQVFRDQFDFEIVPVDDPYVLIDIDTVEDFNAFNSLNERK